MFELRCSTSAMTTQQLATTQINRKFIGCWCGLLFVCALDIFPLNEQIHCINVLMAEYCGTLPPHARCVHTEPHLLNEYLLHHCIILLIIL